MKSFHSVVVAALVLLGTSQAFSSNVILSGDLLQWHKTTLTFTGPNTNEIAGTNPFLDYRLNVTFTQGDKSYVVPGYYAADGNAGNTGASTYSKSNPKISGVVLAKPGEVDAIQLPNSGNTGTLDLSDASGTFTQR